MTSPVSAIEAIEKAMEGVTPDRVERLWWFLHILDKSCGTTNASDDRWNWINAFCLDFEDDTFNRAAKLGFIRVTHNSLTEDSTARLTDAGRAFAAYFSEPPSAAIARQAEALQRENAELAKSFLEVLNAVRDYLPPDGISAGDCLSRVIGAVDNSSITPLIKKLEHADVDA